jgi:hypothetical protein
MSVGATCSECQGLDYSYERRALCKWAEPTSVLVPNDIVGVGKLRQYLLRQTICVAIWATPGLISYYI